MTHITVVNGPASGTQVALIRGETCTIGSAPDCTIRIELPGIAAVQAEIKALRAEGFGIKRAGGPISVNGTSVEAARLAEGDVIDVGSVQLLYGPPSLASRRAEKGRILGGFRLLDTLGKGGMGTVYRAEQVSLHRQGALKVLDEGLTRDPVFVARFVAEARAAARLHHPNVVQVYDVGHEGATYYYSMELMTGSIEKRLKAEGRLDPASASRAVLDAARGLSYAESLRIVHRDIKPDNLMLDQHGTVKLADLGLAMTDENEVSKVVGTPHFMSPEQILRKPLDHRSDLYSLGCTYYRMLTGKNPFSGASVKDILRAQVKEDAEPVHKVAPDVPVEVSAIVQRLMAKDPGERFQSAEELIAAIEEVLKPPARRGLLVGGIVVAVAIAGGAVIYAMTREPKVIQQVVSTVDPSAEENARRAREAEAEVAYVRATRDHTGLALAEALDAVAAAHAGTEHARKAQEKAAEVRAEVAAAEARARQRAEALAGWQRTLAERVRGALGNGDLRAAEAGLALDDVPAELRGDPSLVALQNELAGELQQAGRERLAALVNSVEAARTAEDAAALERAIEALAAALEGDDAWPKAALPAGEEATTTLATARGALRRLREAERARRIEAGWKRMYGAFTDGGGVLAEVRALHWHAARDAAQKVAAELQDQPAGERAAALAGSLARAVAYLDRVQAAAQEGGLTLPLPGEADPCPIAGFAYEGEQAGFTVKVGPRHQPRTQAVRFDALTPDALERALALPGEGDPPGLVAVLGWLELGRQLEAARSYLLALDPQSDTSGTGAEGYPLSGTHAGDLARRLASCSEPWADALRSELNAAALLASGLQAFSGQRNLVAAERVEQLLRDHGGQLLVAALR